MKTQAPTSTGFWANKWGYVGLLLSAIGFIAVFVVGFWPWPFDIIRFATACSLLGAVVSGVGLFRKPRRQAMLGVFLGLFVLYFLKFVA